MKSRRSILSFATVLLSALPVSATAEVVTLTPVADTAFFAQVPDNNLGHPCLSLPATPPPPVRRAP